MTTGRHDRDALPLVLPAGLERKLRAFRGLVRRVKLTEAVCVALCGVLLGYLAVFALDRVVETPRVARLALFAGTLVACAAVPLALHAWVWRQRGLEQVARLLSRTFPSLGDEVLGVIEIVRGGPAAGTASRALCAAAVAQVAERATHYDFARAVPRARHRLWAFAAALPLVAAVALAALAPAAAGNAWRRFLLPWRDVERFTFARIAALPERLVVPHGEPAPLDVALGEASRWRPARAAVRIGRQPPLAAALEEGRYAFSLPAQLEPASLRLAVGDARGRTRLEPMFRPEIAALVAEIELPDYLQRPGTTTQDIRGGTLTAVRGSRVAIAATATRDLAAGLVDGAEVPVTGAIVRTPPLPLDEERKVTIEWRDVHGLAGARPLALAVVPRPDEPPVVVAVDLPAGRDVLLNTDTLRFRVAVRDDFGIRRVGLEWRGLDAAGEDASVAAVKGDRLVQAGGPDRESLDVAATFCPDALGIAPQAIVLRAFAEDYLPGRGRAYSTPVVIYVVDRAEHALVLNTRLQQFRQQASEVRDREMGLLAANKELRGLPEERLADADTRGRLEAQAAAEAANARRLERLVEAGEKLVQEALKNPEFEAATLEQLAEDIQTLADIAGSRMPGVAELLAQAARAERATAGQPGRGTPGGEPGRDGEPSAGEPRDAAGEPAARPDAGDRADSGDSSSPPGAPPPRAGEDRQPPGGGGKQGEPGSQPPVPQVVDRESSQQPAAPDAGGQPPAGGGAGRLGLPSTQAGVAPPGEPAQAEAAPPADEALDDAIAAQEELLERFARVADELAAVMARLEGSTFVKRLKLASREQGTIGSRIAELSAEAFGRVDERPAPVRRALGEVRETNARETDKVSALMDDLQAYFDRRQLPAFRTVLEEMKSLDALGSLRQLSDDIVTEAGMSIAQAEFWSDTFDRLADDLVPPPEPGGSGAGGGEGEPRESVPPEVVLELMKILEDEVTLREETRVAEQTRPALEPAEFTDRGAGLARRQDELADRIVALADRLLEEPDGERSFGPEIGLFEKVEEVMAEAAEILRSPDTGPKAIGAESEAIELLLAAQAAAANQGGGGGGGGGAGGATPGGGGGGDTDQSALALVGRGNRTRGAQGAGEKEQATGLSGRVLPEEFRAGLDDYFNRFEKERR